MLNALRLTMALAVLLALSAPFPARAASEGGGIPSWLQAHVGLGEGQIAPVVLQRARELYLKNRASGEVRKGANIVEFIAGEARVMGMEVEISKMAMVMIRSELNNLRIG